MNIGDSIPVVCVNYDVETIAVIEDGPWYRCQHCENLCLSSSDHYTLDRAISPDALLV
jgi:hypothetical protein